MTKTSGEPLYTVIRKIRQPATLRELIAACLRSVYTGDPFKREQGALPTPPKVLFEEVDVSEASISGVRCVVYSPKYAVRPVPLILYMHGGGFVIGCSEDTDYITRKLCHSNQCVVVSINYRLAPETKFPGALDDCSNVLNWAQAQCGQLAIDDKVIYLAGDSAGANLALGLSQRLASHGTQVTGLILLAPWLDMEVEAYASYNQLAPTGIVFDAPFLGYARAAYVGFEQWKNPLVSPLLASVVQMQPTLVIIGTEDPFLDQALRLRQNAIDSKCDQIEFEIYPEMPHCFYTLPGLFDEEENCYERISAFIAKTRN